MKSNPLWHTARIRALRDLTPSIREFEIVPSATSAPLRHDPGAHVQVQLAVGQGAATRLQTRSYSLVGETDGSCYRIAVKRMDDGRGGSRAMWRLAVGDSLSVSEPANHFALDLDAPAHLLIAGGIGITPLVLMAQRLQRQSERTGAPLRMLYGARSASELAYRELLQDLLGERLQIHTGGDAIDFAAEIRRLPAGAQLYTCGPVPMLESVKHAWAVAGRPLAGLRFETFGSSGRLPAQPFRVLIPRHGLDIHVPADTSLLDALEQAGVQTLSDCRRGECGLCAMDVLQVHGELDHRDVFLSAHEKQQGRRLCVCVSRAVGELTLDSAYRPEA